MKKEGLAPIVLDAGDLLFTSSVLADSNRESETFRASSILDDNMNYPFDAINVGKYELAGGLNLLQKLINKTKSNFISANLRDSNSGRLLFNPYKIIERNDIIFGIIGLTDMVSGEVDGVLQDDYIVSGDQYIMKIKNQVDIIVLMINSARSTYSSLTGLFPLANIILTSGSTMLTRPMMTQEEKGPFLFSSGREGRYLNRIDISLSSKDKTFINKSYYEAKIDYYNRRINRYMDKDPSKSLEIIYKDQPNILESIEASKKDIKRMSFILQESVNTIDFRNVAMDKFIEDDPKVKKFVNETVDRCAKLMNP